MLEEVGRRKVYYGVMALLPFQAFSFSNSVVDNLIYALLFNFVVVVVVV